MEPPFALDLRDGLPQVADALSSGLIDQRRARTIVYQTTHLDDDTARAVTGRIIDEAPHLTTGQPTLGPAYEPTATSPGGPLAARICRLLDEEIRPSVAMDGGDVLFVGIHEGRVELRMRGACSGCPSATATLKMAIEARLREAIPEVREVVAVS